MVLDNEKIIRDTIERWHRKLEYGDSEEDYERPQSTHREATTMDKLKGLCVIFALILSFILYFF